MGGNLDEIITETPSTPATVQPENQSQKMELADNALATPGDSKTEVFHVELSKIVANPTQPRRTFDEGSLASLAESIKTAGVIQPIIVRQIDDHYEVIAGERRWRAAKLAHLQQIPVILRPGDAVERSQIALIENIHREDLNPLERALAYQALLKQTNCTHLELAQKLGEDRSTIANHLRLIDLPDTVRQLVGSGQLSFGHAKLLAGIPAVVRVELLAEMTVRQGLSVRALEKLLKESAAHRPAIAAKVATPHIADLERRISRDLQMRAEVKQAAKGKKGKLVLHYASLDQFDELLNRLGIKVDE
jgi:ParB family chromosome partitioning protein